MACTRTPSDAIEGGDEHDAGRELAVHAALRQHPQSVQVPLDGKPRVLAQGIENLGLAQEGQSLHQERGGVQVVGEVGDDDLVAEGVVAGRAGEVHQPARRAAKAHA